MAWYNNIGDLTGDIGHGLEELLGQRGQNGLGGPMGPGMPGSTVPGQLPGQLPGGVTDSSLRDAILQRVTGSPIPSDGTGQSGDGGAGSTAGSTGDGGWLSGILDDINKYQKPLSLIGQVAGGIEKMRADSAAQKQRQRELDIAQGYYNLASQRAQATQDAFKQLYAQNKYYGPNGGARNGAAGTGSAGTGSAGYGAPNSASPTMAPPTAPSMSAARQPTQPSGLDPNDPTDPTGPGSMRNSVLARLGYLQPLGANGLGAPRNQGTAMGLPYGSNDYYGSYGG